MHPHHLLVTLALALPALASTSISQVGCYSAVPSLKDEGDYTFQSQGYCENKCQKGGFRVAALTGGNQCLCGNQLPPESAQVDDDKCNVKCAGWPEDNCGGQDVYTVLSTGEYAEVSSSSSDSDSSDNSSPATASTAAGGIIVAPTNVNPTSVPTDILTAPDSMVTKASASAMASKSASVTTSASASPTMNAANTLHAGSSVIGAAIAGLGLLL